MRPETAQGIFVNFRRLLDYNNGNMPFAAAQIGTSFRNEISPRSGLLRVREFTMGEIEHFVKSDEKQHVKFHTVAHLTPQLYSGDIQLNGGKPQRIPLGEAVKSGLIANETLGYFVGRIYLFLLSAGIQDDRVRFRQHLPNEMAHYACDCWDAECHTSYGWIECVGCADRSCYDLTRHGEATHVEMIAHKQLDAPKTIEVVEVEPNKAAIGKAFRQTAAQLITYLTKLDRAAALALQAQLEADGSSEIKLCDATFRVEKGMVTIKKYSKTVQVEEYIPSVIEPSFGIGRIIYSILEQNFYARPEDAQRVVSSRATWL